MSNDTFRRASTFPARDRYDFDKPLIEIALGRGIRLSSFAWEEVCIEAFDQAELSRSSPGVVQNITRRWTSLTTE
jgi:hypothetical protein